MPHGDSWLTWLFKRISPEGYRELVASAQQLSPDGSWLAGQPVVLQHVFGALLVFVLVLLVAWLAHRKIRRADDALVPEQSLTSSSFIELVSEATYGMMKGIMGPDAARFFLPLIGTCAFFIFFSNALGLIPGFLPPTDNLNTTAACAIVIFLTTHIFGVKEHGLAYFKHFLGPIIKWYALPLMLLMLLIETISHLVRPVSLAVRLTANIFADHVVIGLFFTLLGAWSIFLPVPVVFLLLGCVVVVVQTLVFCILSTVYIGMAVQHEEH